MFPSPRMIQYGNQVKTWYTGNEIIAYDSKIFKSTPFTDYTGKTITPLSTVYGVSGTIPSLGNAPGGYGVGINLNTGSIGNIGLSPSYLSGSWCVDFWVSYRIIGAANDYIPFYPLMNDNNTSGGTLLEFQPHSSLKYLSVFQGGAWLKTGTDYLNELRTTNYNHFCMQYNNNTKTLYVYVNGILKMTFSSLNYSIPNTTHNGFIWGNYSSRSSSAACIERFRLRSGVYFGSTGFSTSNSSLYPGTLIP